MSAIAAAAILVVLLAAIGVWDWWTDPKHDEIPGDLRTASGPAQEPGLENRENPRVGPSAGRDSALFRDQVRADVRSRLHAMQGGKR